MEESMEYKGRITGRYKGEMMIWTTFASLVTLLVTFLKELRIDGSMEELIFQHSGERLYAISQMAVRLADTRVIIALSVMIMAGLLVTGHRNWASFYFRVMFFGCLLGYLLKEAVSRPRPDEVISLNLWRLGTESVSQSFPSGHAMKILFLIGCILLFSAAVREKALSPWIIGFGGILVLLVGLGQILNGRHFFTDVLGGYSWALAWIYVNLHYESLKKDQGILGRMKGKGETGNEKNQRVWNHHRPREAGGTE